MKLKIFWLTAYIVHTTAKHVISRHGLTRTSAKCTKMKSARLKRAQMFFFPSSLNMQMPDILFGLVVADVHVGKYTFFGNGFL